MMTPSWENGPASLLRRLLNWALVYAAWLICAALALLDAVVLRRVILTAHTALRLSKWSLALADKWGLFALGLVALTAILYAQYYLTQGYPGGAGLGTFPRRFVRVVLLELGVLVASGTLVVAL